ncbi:MAG: mannonate dehydratase [Bacteroidales bacterium]|jgi:mannonate dehydratase
MKRRTFSKALISSIGLSAIGDKVLLASPRQIIAIGNKWSANGLKLGISHQRPNELHEKHINYLKQMGVEYLEIRIPSEQSSLKNIIEIRDKVEKAGLKVFEIMLADKYNFKEAALGLPGRDEEILFFQNFVKDLGKAGIDTTTYAWQTGGVYKTGTTMTRGCRTRLFELESAQTEPNSYDKDFSEAELWDNYEYFIKLVLPVAEDAGVRLQLHPNDPPVKHRGVPRIFSSTNAFRTAMEISDHSPFSGMLFCTGTFAEMQGPDGKGEDLVEAIHEFGSRGHIYQVHFRNVSSTLPDFHETFPDNGYLNMYKVMKALGEVNFNGIVVPDHVPFCENSEAGPETGEAYIFGYIRALIQAVSTELGRLS